MSLAVGSGSLATTDSRVAELIDVVVDVVARPPHARMPGDQRLSAGGRVWGAGVDATGAGQEGEREQRGSSGHRRGRLQRALLRLPERHHGRVVGSLVIVGDSEALEPTGFNAPRAGSAVASVAKEDAGRDQQLDRLLPDWQLQSVGSVLQVIGIDAARHAVLPLVSPKVSLNWCLRLDTARYGSLRKTLRKSTCYD